MNKLILSFFLVGFCFSSPLIASKDFVIVEGDIAIKKSGDKSSFLRTAQRWPGGVIPWTIDPKDSGNKNLIASVQGAMNILNKYTNLVFKRKTDEDKNFLVFTAENNGCYSYVGMQGGPQEVNLSRGCHHDLIVAHEILHAIGMEHEQSRDDRDSHLNINWENIKESQKHNFGMVKRSMFGEYNLNSIMHYGSYSFSKNGQPTMTTKSGEVFEQNLKYFSKGDQEAVNAFYPIKFKFNLEAIDLSFYQDGNRTSFQIEADAEIIKSIGSVVYRINGSEATEEITTWNENFLYGFEAKSGRNVIVVKFILKDGTTEEAEFTYFFTGRKLSVECKFSAKRESTDFVLPITYDEDEPLPVSRQLSGHFASASARVNTETNVMELQMTVGRKPGLIRREQKEERTFSISENTTQKVEVDRAELSCKAINEAL